MKRCFHASCSNGFSLIGLILAVVMLGLLGAAILMLMGTGIFEGVQALDRVRAFNAAESGISAARHYMATHAQWLNDAPVEIEGSVGHAAFSAVFTADHVVTSVGRCRDARWTSVWTGIVEAAFGKPVVEYEEGDNKGNLADFPGRDGDCAQSFTTPGTAISASAIELDIRRTGNPSPVYITLRSESTAGPILAVSNTIDSKDMPTGDSDWVLFMLDSVVDLDPDTMYFIRMSSDPPSTEPKSKAKGTVCWTYRHSAFIPPGYGGGDAWRYIGRNGNPSDQGQRLDNYDYNFRIYD